MTKNFAYWSDDPPMVRKLVGLTREGRKLATVRPTSSWLAPITQWDDVPYTVGEEAVLRDLDGTAHLRVRFTDIYGTTLSTIPEKLWRDEFEPSADEFRRVHHIAWDPLGITGDTPLMAIHFAVLGPA